MQKETLQENKMGVMPVGKLLVNMALPMIISMLVQAMYNIVDSIFVSMISQSALTAALGAYFRAQAESSVAQHYRWYAAHGGDWGAFCSLWTRKESWCKQAGTGIFNPRSVLPPLPGERHETLAVHSFAGDRWRAAVCAEHGEAPKILWLGVTKKEFDPIS